MTASSESERAKASAPAVQPRSAADSPKVPPGSTKVSTRSSPSPPRRAIFTAPRATANRPAGISPRRMMQLPRAARCSFARRASPAARCGGSASNGATCASRRSICSASVLAFGAGTQPPGGHYRTNDRPRCAARLMQINRERFTPRRRRARRAGRDRGW
jgi:hypothetical protein